MRMFVWLLSVVAALACAPAASAQDSGKQAANAQDEIVVKGQRQSEEEVRELANAFVRTLTSVPSSDSFARWSNSVCPRVLGLSDAHATLVKGWFRDVAKISRVKLGGNDCAPNLLILFVDDGEKFIKLFRSRYPKTFEETNGPEIRKLAEKDAPIRWWYSISKEPGGASLIRPLNIRTIEVATVIVDVGRAEGVPLKAASIFAAFVGLTGIKNGVEPRSPSILNLFNERRGQGELSSWDRTFLRELYIMPHDRRALQQRRRLVKALLDEEEAGK